MSEIPNHLVLDVSVYPPLLDPKYTLILPVSKDITFIVKETLKSLFSADKVLPKFKSIPANEYPEPLLLKVWVPLDSLRVSQLSDPHATKGLFEGTSSDPRALNSDQGVVFVFSIPWASLLINSLPILLLPCIAETLDAAKPETLIISCKSGTPLKEAVPVISITFPFILAG